MKIYANIKLLNYKVKNQLTVPLKSTQGLLDKAQQRQLKANNKPALAGITASLKQVEADLDALIESTPGLKRVFTQVTSVPNIGRITALSLLVITGNFKKITTAKQCACHAGVAPFAIAKSFCFGPIYHYL